MSEDLLPDSTDEVMAAWPVLHETDETRPFGMQVGTSMPWHGLTVTRRATLGPNWNYRVTGGWQSYLVNVFNPAEGQHRILVQGSWRGTTLDHYIREDLEVDSPQAALIVALTHVLRLEGIRHGRTLPSAPALAALGSFTSGDRRD